MRHSERHNCATSDMRSNSRKLRRQKECRSQIGTRRMSDRDCRSDSSRPHLLTARTHGVSSQSPHEEASAPGACGVSCLHWAPDRQTGTRQVEWLVARTQPAHSKIPAFPSAEATASATPRLTGCRGLWDMPGHRSAFGKQARSHRSSALSFEAACDFDTATRVHDHHEEATPPAPETFPATMPLDCATW